MSTKPENQNGEIIPWIRDQRTRWSSSDHEEQMRVGDPRQIIAFVNYILWESSTEFMVTRGLPTDADVQMWITWLANREDVQNEDIQQALVECEDYIT